MANTAEYQRAFRCNFWNSHYDIREKRRYEKEFEQSNLEFQARQGIRCILKREQVQFFCSKRAGEPTIRD